MSDIQIRTQTTAHWVRIGVSYYPEQGKTIIMGRDLTTPEQIDGYIDDLIAQLERARTTTKKQLQEARKENNEESDWIIHVKNTGGKLFGDN